MATIQTPGRTIGAADIASNSLSVVYGDLVTVNTSGFVTKAGTTGRIEGVSMETRTFPSDNQTVGKTKLQYVRVSDDTQLRLTVSNGTISAADNKNKFFNLAANGTVDAATKTATAEYVNTSDAGVAVDAVVKMQLRLVKQLSTTEGLFVVVNK